MAEVLELAQLAQDDRVAERQLAAGRVDAELDPQRAAGRFGFGEPRPEGAGGQDLRGARAEQLDLAEDRGRQGGIGGR